MRTFEKNYIGKGNQIGQMVEAPQPSQVQESAPEKSRKTKKAKHSPDGKIIPDMIPTGEFPF